MASGGMDAPVRNCKCIMVKVDIGFYSIYSLKTVLAVQGKEALQSSNLEEALYTCMPTSSK